MSRPHPLDGWAMDGPAVRLDWTYAELLPAERPVTWCCGRDRGTHADTCVTRSVFPNGNT